MSTEWQDQQLTGESESHLLPLGNSGTLIHHAVLSPLRHMITAASHDGIVLTVASGFRSFARQQAIWQAKFSGQRTILDHNSQPLDHSLLTEQQKIEAILRWSALPGTSRHHWGTDLDLYDRFSQGERPLLLEPHEYQQGGTQYQCWRWLQAHAGEFGFYWPYDQDRQGVAPEPWHLSFGSIAESALQQLSATKVLQALDRHQVSGVDLLKPQLERLLNQYVTNVTRWQQE